MNLPIYRYYYYLWGGSDALFIIFKFERKIYSTEKRRTKNSLKQNSRNIPFLGGSGRAVQKNICGLKKLKCTNKNSKSQKDSKS